MPTSHEIAERADVSNRLLFHHFADMEALYHAVAEIEFQAPLRGMRTISSELPLAQRIDRTVRERAKLFESIGHLGWNAKLLARRHEGVARSLARADEMLRESVTTTFASELRKAGRERRKLLSAIDVALSWQTWDHLRRVQRLSAPTSRQVVVRTMRALLA